MCIIKQQQYMGMNCDNHRGPVTIWFGRIDPDKCT